MNEHALTARAPSGGRVKSCVLAHDASGATSFEHVTLVLVIALSAAGSWALLGDETESSARCVGNALTTGIVDCDAGGSPVVAALGPGSQSAPLTAPSQQAPADGDDRDEPE